jgi:predicted NBD/HSP70 family sugar kinase
MPKTRELIERIKKNDAKLSIFNVVRSLKTGTASEIEERVRLSRPTVLKYIGELVNEKLLIERGQGKSSGGRPPKLLSLNSSAVFSIGIDFGAPNLTVALIDLGKRAIDRMMIATRIEDSPSVVANRIVEAVREIASRNRVSLDDQMIGAAVGVPCFIERETELLKPIPRLSHWEDAPLKAMIERNFDFPVFVEIGPHLMVLGEREFGEEKADNMLYIHIREGIGMGVFSDGKLVRGWREDAGEIGHTIVSPGGPRCICGRRGCLEVFASEPAILRRGRKLTGRDDITALDLFRMAREGDAVARETVGEAVDHLAVALVNTIELFDPEIVVLGGNIVEGGNFVMERIKRRLEEHKIGEDRVKVRFSKLGIYAGALGAASFALEKAFEPPLCQA